MPTGGNDQRPAAIVEEVRRFIALCDKRFQVNNALSIGLVLIGYVFFAGAELIGILRENGGRLAAGGTLLAALAIGLEQSFGFSEAAYMVRLISTEAEVLLSEVSQPGPLKSSAAFERLNELRLRLARVFRRSRVDHLRRLVEQAHPKLPPPSERAADDRAGGGDL